MRIIVKQVKEVGGLFKQVKERVGVRISKAACFVGLVVGSVNLELKLYSVRSLEEVGKFRALSSVFSDYILFWGGQEGGEKV